MLAALHVFTVAFVLFLIAEFSSRNPGFHSVTLSAVRASNLRHVLKSTVRQNLSAEQAAFCQSNVSGVFNPSASAPAPASEKRPIYVSDPSKSVICHTFSPGRLGNHLFEYASILGIAETTNKTFFFFNDEELQKVLKHPPVQESSLLMQDRCRHAKKLWNSRGGQYDRRLINLEPGKDYVIGDYLQSWLYFDVTRDAVREAMTFADDIVRNATSVPKHDFRGGSCPKRGPCYELETAQSPRLPNGIPGVLPKSHDVLSAEILQSGLRCSRRGPEVVR